MPPRFSGSRPASRRAASCCTQAPVIFLRPDRAYLPHANIVRPNLGETMNLFSVKSWPSRATALAGR
jgi:hypothetical protein